MSRKIAHQFRKKHMTTSILLTFKVRHWRYEVYNTAASIQCTDALGIPVSWIWRIVCEAQGILDSIHYQLLNWINVLSNPHLACFTTVGFAVYSRPTSLMKLHQQLIQRWWRPASVWNALINFLTVVSITFSLCKILITTLASLLKLFFITFTQQWHVNDVNSRHSWSVVCTGIYKTTLLENLISSLVVPTFKPNFVYSFQIDCKILDINLH